MSLLPFLVQEHIVLLLYFLQKSFSQVNSHGTLLNIGRLMLNLSNKQSKLLSFFRALNFAPSFFRAFYELFLRFFAVLTK